VRAEVELAAPRFTRDVKIGADTASDVLHRRLVVLFYSTFFFFFFLASCSTNWLWRWVAFLMVFAIMSGRRRAGPAGFLKVRRIRGPRQTIESVRETSRGAHPGHDKTAGTRKAIPSDGNRQAPPPIPRVVDASTRSVDHPSSTGHGAHLDVHANGIRFHVSRPTRSDKSDGATEPARRGVGILTACFWFVWCPGVISCAGPDRGALVAVDCAVRR